MTFLETGAFPSTNLSKAPTNCRHVCFHCWRRRRMLKLWAGSEHWTLNVDQKSGVYFLSASTVILDSIVNACSLLLQWLSDSPYSTGKIYGFTLDSSQPLQQCSPRSSHLLSTSFPAYWTSNAWNILGGCYDIYTAILLPSFIKLPLCYIHP